nr:MAG TPA: ASCH domain protein [Caudoviricetes sp.]
MKAITIKQPYASLIVSGIKDIENRSWKTNFRGRVLIHASGCRGKNFNIKLTDSQMIEAFPFIGKKCFLGDIPFGAIIGSVEIKDCVQNHPSIWAEKGMYHWVLAYPWAFPEPIPAKGRLSFWEYAGIQESELDEDGHKVCMYTMNVEEKAQVMRMIDHFECRYCGGRWYK